MEDKTTLGPGPVSRGQHLSQLGPFGTLATRVGARVTGKKNLGVFATIGRAPRLFRFWLLYGASMMPFGYLSRQETEMIILRVAYLRGSAYEADQHRAIAARAGVSSSDIDALFLPEHGITGRRGLLLDATEQIVRNQGLTATMAQRLRELLSEREQVAFVMLVCNYDGLATALDIMAVPVDENR
ncbi:carboxymuconolactone decarboxylase family protein [Corynebacterium auriscanis]|uniref:carboxymuconolactone decarboxylase family protein n=1 Tax=Corynebacterium auriscanis TaxID=99807 RepID=UPI003CF1B59C